MQIREASGVVGTASFCLLFSSSLFRCMIYLVHCKANSKWRQQKQGNGGKDCAVWTWMDPSAIDWKLLHSLEKNTGPTHACVKAFSWAWYSKFQSQLTSPDILSPFVSLQYMSSLYYWSIWMFYSILYHSSGVTPTAQVGKAITRDLPSTVLFLVLVGLCTSFCWGLDIIMQSADIISRTANTHLWLWFHYFLSVKGRDNLVPCL